MEATFIQWMKHAFLTPNRSVQIQMAVTSVLEQLSLRLSEKIIQHTLREEFNGVYGREQPIYHSGCMSAFEQHTHLLSVNRSTHNI